MLHVRVSQVRTFTELIGACCKTGALDASFGLLYQMMSEGVEPSRVTYDIMLRASYAPANTRTRTRTRAWPRAPHELAPPGPPRASTHQLGGLQLPRAPVAARVRAPLANSHAVPTPRISLAPSTHAPSPPVLPRQMRRRRAAAFL